MRDNSNIVLSFDLDNTLIDNKDGIIDSFNYTLREYNLKEKSRIEIEKMIGIPLNDMFTKVCDFDPSEMSKIFRKYYTIKGISQAKLLSGVKEKLKELKKYSFTLGIITSKKQEIAVKVIKFLKIQKYFEYILGESHEIKSKNDPKIKELLNKMYPGYKFIVIGDHPKDAILSTNLNCPFIGVLTGFHSSDDLRSYAQNNHLIINSVQDLAIEEIYSLV